MRWISNDFANVNTAIANRTSTQSPQDAARSYEDMRRGRVVGRPKVSAAFTVEELEAMGRIGLYEED